MLFLVKNDMCGPIKVAMATIDFIFGLSMMYAIRKCVVAKDFSVLGILY